MGQVSPCTTITEPVLSSPHSTTREATTMRSPYPGTRELTLLATTRESPWAAMKTQHNQKLFFLKRAWKLRPEGWMRSQLHKGRGGLEGERE